MFSFFFFKKSVHICLISSASLTSASECILPNTSLGILYYSLLSNTVVDMDAYITNKREIE